MNLNITHIRIFILYEYLFLLHDIELLIAGSTKAVLCDNRPRFWKLYNCDGCYVAAIDFLTCVSIYCVRRQVVTTNVYLFLLTLSTHCVDKDTNTCLRNMSFKHSVARLCGIKMLSTLFAMRSLNVIQLSYIAVLLFCMDGNICASILRLKASPHVFMYSC